MKLAEAFVEIRPEDDQFRAEARRLIEAALTGLEGLVDLGVDGDAFRTEARRVVSSATAALRGEITLEADGSGLRRDISATADAAAAGVAAVVDVDADATGLRGEVSRAAFAAGVGQSINIPVSSGGGVGGGGIGGIPGVGSGGDGVERIGRQALHGAAGLKALKLALAGVKFGALITGATAAVGAITSLAAGATALVGALGPATGILGALPGLATVASQGIGSVLFAASGVGDAVKAMGKAQLDSASGSGAAEAGLLAQEAAAERVRSATISLSDAQENAAERNEAATQRVADAQQAVEDAHQGVSDAVQSSADAQSAAARRVESAERGLEQAQRTAVDAQRALTDARRSAEDQLRSLQERVDDYGLSEEDAILRVAEARQRLGDMPNFSTPIDYRRANLGIRQAEEALDDLRRQRGEDTEELTRAAAKGVDGSDQVVAAQQRVQDSQQAVADSAREVADAQRAAARSAVDSARAIADAQRGVADAVEALSDASTAQFRAQRDGPREVAEAQRNLTVAIRDQERAVQESMGASSAAADNLAAALAELSPEAQRFAEVLFAFRPEIDALQDAAGEKLFPALEAALGNFTTLMPTFRDGAREAGGAIGNFAVNLSELLAASKGDIEIISGRNVDLLNAFGDAGVDVVAALRDVIIAAEPITTFVGEMARNFGAWARESAAAGRESGELTAFFDRSVETLKRLGGVLKNTGTLLGEVFGGGADLGNDLLESYIRLTAKAERFLESVEGQARLKQIFEEARPVLTEIGDLLGDVGTGLLDLSAGSNLASLISQLRTELLPALFDLAGSVSESFGPAIISGITEFVELLGTLFAQGGTMTVLVDAFSLLAGSFNLLVEHLPGFREIVSLVLTLATVRGITTIATKLGGIATKAFGIGGAAAGASGKVSRLVGALGNVGPALVVGAALVAFSRYSANADKARIAAERLAATLTGEGLVTNNLDVLTDSASDVGFAMQEARQHLRDLRAEHSADSGGIVGFLGKTSFAAEGLLEGIGIGASEIAEAERNVEELEAAFAALDPRLAGANDNLRLIADSTGLTNVEVASLADQLGLDIAGPFGANATVIASHYAGIARQAGFSGAAAADASGITLEALQEQAVEVERFRAAVTGAYENSTNVIANFAGAATVSGDEVVAFFEEQVTAAQNWATNLAELAKSGIDEGLLKEVAEAGPAAAPLLQGLLDAVANGGVEAINQARTDLETILGNTLNDITAQEVPGFERGRLFGGAVAGGTETGLLEGLPGVQALIAQYGDDARAILEEKYTSTFDAAYLLGVQLRLGIEAGTMSEENALLIAGGRAVAAVRQGAQDEAETGSPSRLFAREVGKPIAQGLALGVRQGLPDVLRAGEGMVSSLAGLDFSIPSFPGPGVDLGRQERAVRAGLAVPAGDFDVEAKVDGSLGPLLDELRRLRDLVANLQANVSFGDIKVEAPHRDVAGDIPKAIRRQHSLGRF